MTRTLVVLCALAVGACTESDHKVQDLPILNLKRQGRHRAGANCGRLFSRLTACLPTIIQEPYTASSYLR
jgi:hypothetical protein